MVADKSVYTRDQGVGCVGRRVGRIFAQEYLGVVGGGVEYQTFEQLRLGAVGRTVVGEKGVERVVGGLWPGRWCGGIEVRETVAAVRHDVEERFLVAACQGKMQFELGDLFLAELRLVVFHQSHCRQLEVGICVTQAAQGVGVE